MSGSSALRTMGTVMQFSGLDRALQQDSLLRTMRPVECAEMLRREAAAYGRVSQRVPRLQLLDRWVLGNPARSIQCLGGAELDRRGCCYAKRTCEIHGICPSTLSASSRRCVQRALRVADSTDRAGGGNPSDHDEWMEACFRTARASSTLLACAHVGSAAGVAAIRARRHVPSGSQSGEPPCGWRASVGVLVDGSFGRLTGLDLVAAWHL